MIDYSKIILHCFNKLLLLFSLLLFSGRRSAEVQIHRDEDAQLHLIRQQEAELQLHRHQEHFSYNILESLYTYYY